MAKTVVGLFDNFAEAQSVVQDLIDNGFRREDISVVANESAAGRERVVGADPDHESAAAEGAGAGAVGGTVLGGALGLLVGAGLLAIPGIGPVLAAGPLAAAIGTTAATVGATALGAGIGAATGGLIGGLVGAGVPKEEAEYYAEGVRRGGTLVSVNTDDAMANTAYDIMTRHDVVDIDERANSWRSSGWTGYDASTEPMDRPGAAADSMTRDRMVHSDDVRSDVTRAGHDADAVLPVVEEQIDIDKRRVDKGGVRVTSRVEERPVEEQVNLHEERVNVERRRVDRPVTDADAEAFKETSFEVRESVEEPVVRKTARVVEEVIVDTEARDRAETVRDTVRRTDVDVQQSGGMNTGASAGGVNAGPAGAMRDFDAYDNDYRSHYQKTYGSAGYTYDDYAPVYRYGHSLATDTRYSGRDWADIEMDARRRWEDHNPGTWEQFKDTVRYAWDKARGRR